MAKLIFIALFVLFTFCISSIYAHAACQALARTAFDDGSQKCDCDYTDPTPTPANAIEHAIDLYWIRYVHNYTMTHMSRQPFGAALVDSRNNSLVTIGYNMFYTGDPFYSSITVSHAETVVMTNASVNILTGSWNETTQTRRVDPNWRYMTLYGNIETCPMCAQAALWRGVRRMVFGARASELKRQRCWNQPTLSVYEVVDHNAYLATSTSPMQVVRGPLSEVEDMIVQDFPNYCTSTPTTTPTTSPTSSPNSTNTTNTTGAPSSNSVRSIPSESTSLFVTLFSVAFVAFATML